MEESKIKHVAYMRVWRRRKKHGLIGHVPEDELQREITKIKKETNIEKEFIERVKREQRRRPVFQRIDPEKSSFLKKDFFSDEEPEESVLSREKRITRNIPEGGMGYNQIMKMLKEEGENDE